MKDQKSDGANGDAGTSPDIPPEAQDLTVFVQSVMEQMVRMHAAGYGYFVDGLFCSWTLCMAEVSRNHSRAVSSRSDRTQCSHVLC